MKVLFSPSYFGADDCIGTHCSLFELLKLGLRGQEFRKWIRGYLRGRISLRCEVGNEQD
jgi:hypothetical protein